MAALTTERKKTNERVASIRQPGVSAAKKCIAGGIAVLNGGFAEPGTTALNLVAIGRFEETVDNTDGADGDLTVRVKRGCFPFENSAAADQITAAEIGSNAYIVDDQTVAKTSGTNTRSVAGKIFDVDAEGVWVEIG